MDEIVAESGGYAQLAASANVCAGPAALLGIFVSSASSTPTITVYDDAGTGTTKTLVAQFTPSAGQYYKLPFRALKGLYIVLGGSVECTVGFCPGTTK